MGSRKEIIGYSGKRKEEQEDEREKNKFMPQKQPMTINSIPIIEKSVTINSPPPIVTSHLSDSTSQISPNLMNPLKSSIPNERPDKPIPISQDILPKSTTSDIDSPKTNPLSQIPVNFKRIETESHKEIPISTSKMTPISSTKNIPVKTPSTSGKDISTSGTLEPISLKQSSISQEPKIVPSNEKSPAPSTSGGNDAVSEALSIIEFIRKNIYRFDNEQFIERFNALRELCVSKIRKFNQTQDIKNWADDLRRDTNIDENRRKLIIKRLVLWSDKLQSI
jgi:hypothetical protein